MAVVWVRHVCTRSVVFWGLVVVRGQTFVGIRFRRETARCWVWPHTTFNLQNTRSTTALSPTQDLRVVFRLKKLKFVQSLMLGTAAGDAAALGELKLPLQQPGPVRWPHVFPPPKTPALTWPFQFF